MEIEGHPNLFLKFVSPTVRPVKRLLLRSGKSPFDVVPVEEALHRDVFATNSGNLIFSDAAHKILTVPGRTEVVSNGIATDVNAAARINEEYDAFVVPLANAFRPSFEVPLQRLTRLISKLKIPVVVLGVGAQAGLDNDAARLKAMEPTVRGFVSAVLDHSARSVSAASSPRSTSPTWASGTSRSSAVRRCSCTATGSTSRSGRPS